MPLFIGFASAAAYSSYNGISETAIGVTSAPVVINANVNVTGYGQNSPQDFAQYDPPSSDPGYLTLSADGGNTVVINGVNETIIQHLSDSEGNGLPLYSLSTAGSFVLHLTVSHYTAGEWFQITLFFTATQSIVNLGSPSVFYSVYPGEVSNLSLPANPQNGLDYLGTSSEYFTTQGLNTAGMNYAYLIGPYSHHFLPNHYLKFFEQPYYTNATLIPGVTSSNPRTGTPNAAGFCLDFGLSSWSSLSPSSLEMTIYVPVT